MVTNIPAVDKKKYMSTHWFLCEGSGHPWTDVLQTKEHNFEGGKITILTIKNTIKKWKRIKFWNDTKILNGMGLQKKKNVIQTSDNKICDKCIP